MSKLSDQLEKAAEAKQGAPGLSPTVTTVSRDQLKKWAAIAAALEAMLQGQLT